MDQIKRFINHFELESYDAFHKSIRSLPQTPDKQWDFSSGAFHNSDVDAFRHAYVSGVFTMRFNETVSKIFGQLKELEGAFFRSQPAEEKNMDLWNNQVGRKYGIISQSKDELTYYLSLALKNNELIISPDAKQDARQYEPFTYSSTIDPNKPVMVLEEKETGLNETFINLLTGTIMSRDAFVSEIDAGNYPGYTVMDTQNMAIPVSKPDSTTTNNLG